MGVLEFFGTLIKNNITSTSIKSDFMEKIMVNHLFMDFNSIIHVSSVKIISDINIFLQLILNNLYNHRAVNNPIFTEKFIKYDMQDIQKNINQNSDPEEIIRMFKSHFTDIYLDKLIITLVINTTLRIIKTYCQNKHIQTLMLAIDGVPSKGKMVEQKQRRYMGAITEAYKRKILKKYKDYLLNQPGHVYLATRYNIKWSRNKITPGTYFMHKLVNYLKSEYVQGKFKINRPNMKIVISDMYEIGEGEKKIVNYVNKYLPYTDQSVMVYSPDADVILFCMLLPVKKLYMLRHNDQTSKTVGKNVYDLIDILSLKSNISYYINRHPFNSSKIEFDTDRINYDIVNISTIFGNDFVPKIETLNVKKSLQNIIDSYLKTLLKFRSEDKEYYLVKTKTNGGFGLNFTFLKNIFRNLLPEEDDFIKHNNLYAQFISLGQIKNVFDYVEINSKNLVPIYNQFRQEYEDLKNLIKHNGNYTYYETNDQFMGSLKKSINIIIDGQCVTTSYLTNKEMISLLKKYYFTYKNFPRLNINLNTWSHSISDPIHQKEVKEKKYNDYQKEIYKFDKMLDEYYIKFNAQPLALTQDKIKDYYLNYFGIKLYEKNHTFSKEANQVMHDYLEGILWVFNYYFNDKSYINWYYYEHERAPLMRHLVMFLDSINQDYFTAVQHDLNQYSVDNIENYFNPIEQLIYVSPMIDDVIRLLPSNYRKYITSAKLDPFLQKYFVDIFEITDRIWNESVSKEIDCRGIIYFNKCLIKSIEKPSASDDKHYLKAIRNVKPSPVSKIRSKIVEPKY